MAGNAGPRGIRRSQRNHWFSQKRRGAGSLEHRPFVRRRCPPLARAIQGTDMTYPVDAALLQLQREYLGSMPQKLDELRSDIAALGSGAEAERIAARPASPPRRLGRLVWLLRVERYCAGGGTVARRQPGLDRHRKSVFPGRAARGRRPQSRGPARRSGRGREVFADSTGPSGHAGHSAAGADCPGVTAGGIRGSIR